MAKRADGLALVQPRGEDFGHEVVVRGEFWAEEGFAVVPEGVQAGEQSGLVGWRVGFGVEEGEEARCDFALEEAQVGGWYGGRRPGSYVRGLDNLDGFGGLAFEDWLVDNLLRSSGLHVLWGWWLTTLGGWKSLGWNKLHSVYGCTLYRCCRNYLRIRCCTGLIRCALRKWSTRSTSRMWCERTADVVSGRGIRTAGWPIYRLLRLLLGLSVRVGWNMNRRWRWLLSWILGWLSYLLLRLRSDMWTVSMLNHWRLPVADAIRSIGDDS